MFDSEFKEERIEGKDKILEVLKVIFNSLLLALREDRPFIITGVITSQLNMIEPLGLSCGDTDKLIEMLPNFNKNNEVLLKALNLPLPITALKTNGITAKIDKKEDGGIMINFN